MKQCVKFGGKDVWLKQNPTIQPIVEVYCKTLPIQSVELEKTLKNLRDENPEVREKGIHELGKLVQYKPIVTSSGIAWPLSVFVGEASETTNNNNVLLADLIAPIILEMYDDCHKSVRMAAIETLKELYGVNYNGDNYWRSATNNYDSNYIRKQIVPFLQHVAEDEKEELEIRFKAINTLRRIETKETFLVLNEWVNNESKEIHKGAMHEILFWESSNDDLRKEKENIILDLRSAANSTKRREVYEDYEDDGRHVSICVPPHFDKDEYTYGWEVILTSEILRDSIKARESLAKAGLLKSNQTFEEVLKLKEKILERVKKSIESTDFYCDILSSFVRPLRFNLPSCILDSIKDYGFNREVYRKDEFPAELGSNYFVRKNTYEHLVRKSLWFSIILESLFNINKF